MNRTHKDAQRRERIFLLWNVAGALLLGGLIYILCAPEVIFLQKWLLWEGNEAVAEFSRKSTVLVLMRNFLPDILWSYALVFCLQAILQGNTKKPWLAGAIALAFSWVIEWSQKTGWMPGTFDIVDLTVQLLSVVVAVLIILLQAKKEKRK